MKQQVGIGHHAESGRKRLNQIVRQLADEPHRVGHQHRLAAGQSETAGGGVQCGEETIAHQGVGPAKLVEQGGLARIRVAHDGDFAKRRALPLLALSVAATADFLQLPL